MLQFNDFLPVHTPQLTADSGTVTGLYRWDRRLERVHKLTYNYRTRQWVKTPLMVEIEHEPFSKGSCRAAYRMKVEGQPNLFVAKKSLNANDVRASYEMDVAMQAMCQEFAQRFNALNPPKKVTFLEAFLIERIEVPGVPVMACEAMLQGEFHKFNNNYGYKSDDERNTPQAFSHFTYVASRGNYIVVDVQGTGDANTPDVYTDPQIHAPNLPPTAFGKGNLRIEGVRAFFRTHKCNSICVGLGLSNKLEDFIGTVMQPARPQLPIRPPSAHNGGGVASSPSPPHRTSSPHRTNSPHRRPNSGAAKSPGRPVHLQVSPVTGNSPIPSPGGGFSGPARPSPSPQSGNAKPSAGLSPFSSPNRPPSANGGAAGAGHPKPGAPTPKPVPRPNSASGNAGTKPSSASSFHQLVHRGKEMAQDLLHQAGIAHGGAGGAAKPKDFSPNNSADFTDGTAPRPHIRSSNSDRGGAGHLHPDNARNPPRPASESSYF